jgi:hypothetical protein
MTQDEIIKLAREAGWDINDLIDVFDFGVRLERFATLVVAAEREACAKVCEEIMLEHDPFDRQAGIARRCLGDIRARGNT